MAFRVGPAPTLFLPDCPRWWSRTDLLPLETAPLCRRLSEVVPWPRRVLPSRVLAGPWQGAGRLVQEARSVREEVGWATARGKLLSGQDLAAVLWPGIGLQPAPFPPDPRSGCAPQRRGEPHSLCAPVRWCLACLRWGVEKAVRQFVNRWREEQVQYSLEEKKKMSREKKKMSRKSKALESQKVPVAFVMDTVPPQKI